MDIGSILLILSAAILSGVFISRPFSKQPPGNLVDDNGELQEFEHKRSSLLADQERLINALRELEFDYNMEKIPSADYPIQRSALLNAGAAVLRQLDEMDASHRGVSSQAAANEFTAQLHDNDDELEALIEERRRNRMEKSTGFCPNCGKPTKKSDLFCPRCGAQLVED